MGPNSAAGTSAAVIVVSVRRQSCPSGFDLVNRLEQPLAPSIGELNFPDLLSGIDDERTWNRTFICSSTRAQ